MHNLFQIIFSRKILKKKKSQKIFIKKTAFHISNMNLLNKNAYNLKKMKKLRNKKNQKINIVNNARFIFVPRVKEGIILNFIKINLIV